jgi:hypothetical protein
VNKYSHPSGIDAADFETLGIRSVCNRVEADDFDFSIRKLSPDRPHKEKLNNQQACP